MVRGLLLLVVGATLAACVQDADHLPVHLRPPYSDLPPAPPGTPIETGRPVKLDARQQEAVVVGVTKWMKTPASVGFGEMAGARNSRGLITVCGGVSGRNAAGVRSAVSLFIGVLMGTQARPDFVVVEIGASGHQRATVEQLCQESGLTRSI
jgi:hypothetical protein